MAGYSATPLQKKLGFKPGMRVLFTGAPDNYREILGTLAPGIKVLSRAGRDLDLVHVFCRRKSDLRRRLTGARNALASDGMLWISWPKKSSGLQTDLGESDVRAAGLAAGLVDVKICAVDDTWSGLKFVYRLRDR